MKTQQQAKHYRIFNLQSQKGKLLNNQICQIIFSSQFKDNRLNVKLVNKNDPTIYRVKLQNLQPIDQTQAILSTNFNQQEQQKVKQFLLKYKNDTFDLDQALVSAWLAETHGKKCFIGNQTIAFMSKNDFDREMKHKEPWMLDYIYTIPKMRRKGKALELLKQIKTKLETSALCSSQQSVKLFAKAGFHKGSIQPMPGMITVMRFP